MHQSMSGTAGYPSAPSAPPAPSSYQSWPQQPRPGFQSYGQPPPSAGPYGQPPTSAGPYGQPPPNPYGYPQHWSQPPPYGYPPPPNPYQSPLFPPGTDPEIVRSFQLADQDGSGFIDDRELQRVLSSSNHQFSLRTVHLLMFLFNNNTAKIGPKEFTALWQCIRDWRVIFERFDRDRSGKIDSMELRDALLSLGYAISQPILQILLSKYDRTGQGRGIDYDNFIECGIIVKGLTDKFKEKDTRYTGSATLTYEAFMLMILPFIVA